MNFDYDACASDLASPIEGFVARRISSSLIFTVAISLAPPMLFQPIKKHDRQS
jgi:hypothetical protein